MRDRRSEREREYHREYYKKNRERICAWRRAYFAEHPEKRPVQDCAKHAERQRKWRAENPEKWRAIWKRAAAKRVSRQWEITLENGMRQYGIAKSARQVIARMPWIKREEVVSVREYC